MTRSINPLRSNGLGDSPCLVCFETASLILCLSQAMHLVQAVSLPLESCERIRRGLACLHQLDVY